MFRYTSLREQILIERQKNAVIKAQTEKNAADIDYIAMMSDIELETNDSEETEAMEDEQ